MFHAYEVVGEDRVRREDLPSFSNGQEVALYLTNNNHVSQRDGVFVKLEWHWEEGDGPATH